MKLVFIDSETTSLRPDRRAWDIGLIVREDDGDVEHQFYIHQSDLDLGNADLMSLKVGRFHDRHPDVADPGDPWGFRVYSEWAAMAEVERLTRGAFLAGAVPNFDAEVFAARMRAHGICPSWHYHLVDVETLAAGRLGIAPPWGFDSLLATFGLTYEEADRHTAIGDARMARDLYDAVMTRAVQA